MRYIIDLNYYSNFLFFITIFNNCKQLNILYFKLLILIDHFKIFS